MAAVDARDAIDGVQAFVAFAAAHLATCLGAEDPSVAEGQRALEKLGAIRPDAVLVTPESLAEAMRRAYPVRRSTPEMMALTAASIIAALRTGPSRHR
jgi:hypothetical protein